MSIDDVTDVAPRVQYTAAASQAEFDYPFSIFDDGDIVVDVDGTLLVLTDDYTVSGAGDDTGGTITLVDALAGGEIVTLYRDTVIERTSDYQQNGPLASEAFNDDLDRLTIICQELKAKIGRSLRIPFTAAVDDADIELIVANWANKYVTFDANGKPTPAALSSTAMTRAIIGGLLYPISTNETNAGVTAGNINDISRPYWDALRYAVGNGVTDDTLALRRACAVLQANGGGMIDFGANVYKIYTDTADLDPIGLFDTINGIELRASGAEFRVQRAFATAITIEVFRFEACNRIKLGPMAGTSPNAARSEIFTRGAQMFAFYEGCTNIEGSTLTVTDFSMGYRFRREQTDSLDFRCKNIDCGLIKGLRTGYPCSGTLSGVNIRANVETDSCGRSIFFNGIEKFNFTIRSKNHVASADCLIQCSDGFGMEDGVINYTDRETTTQNNGLNHVVLEMEHQTPGKIRNIDIHLDILASGGGYSGYGVYTRKLDNSNVEDLVDRGHTLDNIRISGSIISDTANQRSIAFGGGTWSTGENVDNFDIHDLRIVGTGQPNFDLAALLKVATFRNVRCVPQMNVLGNTAGKITMIGCSSDGSLTPTSGDTSRMTYIGCDIGSAGNQSLTNKTFIDCNLAGVHTTRFGNASVALTDGVAAPATAAGFGQIYIDTSDGDLKIKYGDGTVKTIVVDT